MPVWTIAGKDLRLLMRDPRAAIILLLMPILFILVLGLSLGEGFGRNSDAKLRISVVNLDAGPPEDAGDFPGRPWSQVVLDDLSKTAGIRIERIDDLETAERLVRRGERPAVVVIGESFSRSMQRCTFLAEGGLFGIGRSKSPPGINPFYRDGIDIRRLDVAVLRDPTQAVGAAVVDQVVQVSLLRVVMPWMIGRAFDRVAETLPQPAPLMIQRMFSRYDLRAKTWADLTLSRGQSLAILGQLLAGGTLPSLASPNWAGLSLLDSIAIRDSKTDAYQEDGSGWLKQGAIRYQILVPSYTVMFAFFLVLTCGWLFVGERRQGTWVRLRAAPIARHTLLLGKMLPCLGIAVVQGMSLFLAGKIIFGMNWGPSPVMLLPVILGTAWAATGVAMLVAGFARTETQVAIYGTLLVLVLAGVSGTLMPREFLPEEMRLIRLFTPHAWAVDAYSQLLIAEKPELDLVWRNSAVLGLFGLGTLLVAWWKLQRD
ncbi:ABC transporter permease [Tuwongella immobilis]|uniref:ABC transmembrane type-2 domain-containing protein n=1 Tax=Tuwongella immobilis TaxID=692036 RepID=A0A6C2YN57_9BACT|nr:ABC transporter permease [Tuwongella immobilis]VIP02332.1 abc-2 type transporter : Uncharacterized protein OS=Streptomyces mobaraensis NBRC 13819 = DSM 40847 GN=H340_03194 PE=4 SV=1: ABC2_membrane_3 [Tuwongella immobilis]VTS01082.1 abc-2 type transporter : Uncharacterized protein OS=Streptomyces mobaraensis NBRC 13819 = DSM 40847 GN=H340_03194 PE=4 SV=1: ABC2_membrane_3 [Tuwongella immobilis]